MSDAEPTIKQEAFAHAYIETGNASEAYRRVYDVSPDAKPNTIEKRACELLKNGKVAARVAELRAAAMKRLEITADRVLNEYAKIAFADAGDFFDWGPDGVTVKDKSELTPAQRSVVSEVCQTITEKGGTIRVKLHDKQNALEKLGRHLGIFEKDNEQAGKAAAEAIAEAANANSRDVARAIMDIFREAQTEKKEPDAS